jgi:hypothetical protein
MRQKWKKKVRGNRELNEIRKMNRRESWGIGIEGSWLLAFSLPPTLPISLKNFTLKGSFCPREEEAKRAMETL